MKVEIHCCDVCGADHSPENPVNVRVSNIAKPQSPSNVSEARQTIFGMLMCGTDDAETVDLCQSCGGGLIALLRAAAERHAARKRASDKVHPARSTDGLRSIEDIYKIDWMLGYSNLK